MLRHQKFISIELNGNKLRERNRSLSMLLEMSSFLASTLDLNELLNGSLSKVLDFFSLDAGRIYLLEADGIHLSLAAHRGLDPEGLETLSVDEGFSGLAVRTQSFTAQYVSELKDGKRADLLKKKGLRIVICVPLIIGDKSMGVMNLATRRFLTLDPAQIDLMTAIGNQIAVAARHAGIYADLKQKLELLGEKNEMIKFFAYSVSHDLKNPSVSIYGLTRRLRDNYAHRLDEKGKEYCERIMKTAEDMGSLVEKINAFIIAREAPLACEEIRMDEVLNEIGKEFAAELRSRGVRWSVFHPLPVIMGDRVALTRVFRNLIDNALKYGGAGLSKIEIAYRETSDRHVFVVSDDGEGIPPGETQKIFDVFERVGTSKGVAGSGLGLAIVKEIVERHHGRVWIDNTAKRGATFHISLLRNRPDET